MNDLPTVTREINFTKDWGFTHYVKCNVLDYRATKQPDLLKEFVFPRSDRNLDIIIKAAKARRQDHPLLRRNAPLQHYAYETIRRLRHWDHGARLFCMGKSLNGHPRAPPLPESGH